MKKYVWTYPIVGIVVITFMAMFLQSCGVVRLDKMNKLPTTDELDKQIKAVSWILGFTLITGVSFCAYIYSEIKKLEGKIEKLTAHDND